MAANDLIKVEGGELIIQAAGASLGGGLFAQCTGDTSAPADNPGYPLHDIEFSGTWANPTGIEGQAVRIYSRKINFEGSDDAPAPGVNYPRDLLGSFFPAEVATPQNLVLEGVPRSLREEEFWIENGTIETLTDWGVKAYPVTHRPSAA